MSPVDTSAAVRNQSVGLLSISLGKKILMAVSGLIAFSYVVGHMLGNMQIFMGQNQLNKYAETLHSMGPILWVVRIFLFSFFVIHVWKGIQLKLENYGARPEKYRKSNTVEASLASRTMIWTGLTVLAFLIYHIMHLTLHTTNPEYNRFIDELGRPDVYSMVITGFQHYWISVVYIIGVGGVCYHLSHGFGSMFQSVGLNRPTFQPTLDKLSIGLSFLIFLGYIAIPVSVMAGWLTLPGGGR